MLMEGTWVVLCEWVCELYPRAEKKTDDQVIVKIDHLHYA